MGENIVLALFVSLPCISGWALRRFGRKRKAQKTHASGLEIVASNLLLLSFLISFIVLGGEAYYRFFYDSTDSLSYTKTSQRWFQRYWHENALRVRDDIQYSYNLTPGTPRISFVGDSFTAGHGVKRVDDRFVNIIRRAHPGWEVHMLAQLALETGDEINILREGLKHGYQLDHVVLVYCLNDISDMIPEWRDASARIKTDLDNTGWLRRNSYFINTLFHRWIVKRNPYVKSYFGFMVESYRGPLWQRQQLRLKAFRDLVEANRGRLSVVTFPFLHASGPNYEYRFVHEQLREFWSHLNVPYLDLLEVYEKLPSDKLTVNRFDAHPNEYAHALAATAIDNFLQQQLRAIPN